MWFNQNNGSMNQLSLPKSGLYVQCISLYNNEIQIVFNNIIMHS